MGKRLVPSKYRIVDNIVYLEVYNKEGEVVCETMVSLEDLDKVKGYRLYLCTFGARVMTNTREKFHRIILSAGEKTVVDHINRNPLDNRKENLRFVNRQQSNMNRSKAAGKTSVYKGVHWDKWTSRWKVEIGFKKKRIFIGRFDNEEEAALAYNKLADKYFGEYAVLNKIKCILPLDK